MYNIDDISNLIDTIQDTTLEFSQAYEMNEIPYEELIDDDIEHEKTVAYGRLLRDAKLFNVLKIKLNEKELA